MKKPSITAGIAFGVGSLLQLLVGNYFVAAATGLFAAGLLLSGADYRPASAKVAAGSRRSWRNLIALLLAASSIYLFGYDIGRDLYRLTHQSATEKPAK